VALKGNAEGVILGELDGRMADHNMNTAHMYVCKKNKGYNPVLCRSPFQPDYLKNDGCAVVCPSCGLTFTDYRGKMNVDTTQQKMWRRRWNGHLIHCKHN
jgi:hypothetical protein